MNKKLLVSLSICFSALAQAADKEDNPFYYGGGYASTDVTLNSAGDDVTLNAVYGRYGRFYSPFISAELRAALGVGHDDFDDAGTSRDVELSSLYGAYVRGGMQFNQFYPYLIAGVSRASTSIDDGPSQSESDVSVGAGIDFDLFDNVSFNIEYMNYTNKDDYEVESVSLSIIKYIE